MLYRMIILISLAGGALAVANAPSQAQPGNKKPAKEITDTTKQVRSKTVLLKTSGGACVYIDTNAPNFAKLKSGSQACNPGDSKLRFKYTSPGEGFMLLQHLDTGLCLFVDPDNRTDVGGFACSQPTGTPVDSSFLKTASWAPLQLRQTFYPVNPGPPLHRCLWATSYLNIKASDCTSTHSSRNFTLVDVQ